MKNFDTDEIEGFADRTEMNTAAMAQEVRADGLVFESQPPQISRKKR